MKLIISEKNIAAKRIAEILAVGKPTADKVYTTPVYRFRRDGDDWVSIGLKGHIMEVDFPSSMERDDGGWVAVPHTGKPVKVELPEWVTSSGADSPVELRRWTLDGLPFLVYAPVEKVPAEKGIIQSLKNLGKKASEVIVATDYDREGELIGADARDIVRSVNEDVPISRVRFSAFTPEELEKALADPDDIAECLAEAGGTRQDIDLMWGATLTRYLTLAHQTKTRRPYGDVLSSGRVQTPTLKLIVDREAERDAFEPEDYWVVKGRFSSGGEEFVAPHAGGRFDAEKDAAKVLDAVSGANTGTVTAVESTRRPIAPPAPFNTTSLMAAASSEGLTPARTMRIAEGLYMRGLISYPRVDNTVYPPSLDLKGMLKTLAEVPAYREHANAILAAPLTPTRGKKEATDHPPVHPTGAGDPDSLKPEDWKLYNLVARRFMATLSKQAVIEGTRVDIDVAGEGFVAKGDVLAVPGFRAVYPYGMKKSDHLPPMQEGQAVDFAGADLEQKQTQPPARYSAGKLIQEMEKLGLGTKATRHDIIQNLYDRRYVQSDPIEPTCKGVTVVGALTEHAERITTPAMTQELESEMDAIANEHAHKGEVVAHSRALLGEVVRSLLPMAETMGETLKSATDEDAKVGPCPSCEGDLMIKFSPKNKSYFVGCTRYPECEQTYGLPRNAKYQAVSEPCEACGTPQVRVMKFKSRARIMCLSPDCPTKKGPEFAVGVCPKCGGELSVRYSQFGSRFVRCENFDMEKHPVSYPLPQSGEVEPTGETCGPCGAPVVVVHTKRGPWRICVDPDCETKPKRRGAGAKPGGTKTKRRKPSAGGARRKAASGDTDVPRG